MNGKIVGLQINKFIDRLILQRRPNSSASV